MNNKNRQKAISTGLQIAMFTLYRWYRIAFAPARKLLRTGLLFTHNNGDFGEIFVTERNMAVPCRSLKWRVTYQIGVHIIADSFSCQCHVSTKSYPVQCELGQWISAASSPLSGGCDSPFSHVHRKKLPHLSLRTFLNEWNAYNKTLGMLKNKLKQRKAVQPKLFLSIWCRGKRPRGRALVRLFTVPYFSIRPSGSCALPWWRAGVGVYRG